MIVLAMTLVIAGPLRAEETTPYSEDNLIDITDQGLFDSSGKPLSEWQEPAPSVTPAEPQPAEPSSEEDAAPYQESILSHWGSQSAFNQERLRGMKEELIKEKQNFLQLGQQVKEIENKLTPFQKEISSLKEQVELFNRNIEATQKQIELTEQMIVTKQLDIKSLMKETEISRVALADQQHVVLEFIAMMYHEEERYLDVYSTGTDTFKLLLADRSVGESLQGQEYMRLVEQLGRDFFHELELRHRDLSEKQKRLEKQQSELAMLYDSSNAEKKQLQEQRISKQDILDKTQGEEKRYQELLEEALRQQMESMIAIENMKDSIGFIESKLDTLDEAEPTQPPIEESQGNFEETSFVLPPSSELLPEVSKTPLDWPVSPERGLSASFHDATYPKRWGIHEAVDIRTPTGTPIRAPANSYVFETRDNGMGYSYIILAHKGNLVTVYGHVADILVKPGMVVRKGETIGLTGGMPGTKGAGLQTTGPHLHFEVYKNGKHVDPLTMLPVWELPMDDIPEEFLDKLKN